jgi:hypothetical protein
VTDKEILQLMSGQMVSEIENKIATDVGSFVNREFVDFLVGSLRREIVNSGLAINYLRDKLNSDKGLLISFGIALLKSELGRPAKEEYPEGEEPENLTDIVPEHQGMGVGFSIKYLIYLYFLENNKQINLLEYLKKERIPYAKEFCTTLVDVYSQCISNSTDMR